MKPLLSERQMGISSWRKLPACKCPVNRKLEAYATVRDQPPLALSLLACFAYWCSFGVSALGVSAAAPIPGFTLADSKPLIGDAIERAANWQEGNDLSDLAGKPVRLRFVMQDADLFSFRFRP